MVLLYSITLWTFSNWLEIYYCLPSFSTRFLFFIGESLFLSIFLW